MSALSKKRKRLEELESQVSSHITEFGRVLGEIHAKELYLETHETWEKYCKDRWGIGKSYGYKLIKTAKTLDRVSTIVDTDAGKMPKISHLEALSEAPEKQQASIFAEVSEQAELENRAPTAKDFKKAVRAVLPAPKKKTTKATSDDSPPDPVQNGAVESSVGRQPGDES